MQQGSKSKKKTKKEEIPNIDPAFQDELDKYLKIAEKEIKDKEQEEKITKNIQNCHEEKLTEIKNFSNEGKCEEIFNAILELMNQNAEFETSNQVLKGMNDTKTKECRAFIDEINASEKRLSELDNYNKGMLEKIKGITDEKNKAIAEEAAKTEGIRGKCDAYKKEIKKKFDVTDIEVIKKDNATLQEKLIEYKEGTKQIEESLVAQLNLKEKQTQEFQQTFQNQIQGKLDELLNQSDQFSVENKDLKIQVKKFEKKYEEMTTGMSKYNSQFEAKKKEYEKVVNQMIKLAKENRELKSMDLNTLQEQTAMLKKELEVMIAKNKEVQEKIKKLKEDSQNK